MRLIKLIILLLVFGSPLFAADYLLHDWNSGSGTTWSANPSGLSWSTDVDGNGSNHHGWLKDGGDWRFKEKSDYSGVDVTAEVLTTDRGPSTSEGGCLRLYEGAGATTHQCSWWFIYPDRFADIGYSDSNTNRMDFYAKFTMDPVNIGSSDPANANVHIGTYLCADGSCPADPGGDEEGPGNRHYYHYLTVCPGAWIKINLGRTPEHLRDPGPNPTEPVSLYFQDLDRMYMEIRSGQTDESEMLIDEIRLLTTSEEENDTSVGSLWIGYWSADDKWKIGWSDPSFSSYGDSSISTFEVRWSTSPITNANYSSATVVEPEYNELGTSNTIRRPNPWKRICQTQFELPDETETSASKIYFAIKDVSATANGDGHDAPSNLIRTIEYDLACTDSASGPVNTASGTASWR